MKQVSHNFSKALNSPSNTTAIEKEILTPITDGLYISAWNIF